MNPEEFEVEDLLIAEVKPGMSLVVMHEGQAIIFQVENVKFSYKPDTGTVYTLESEPLEDGQPLRIEGGPATRLRRIKKKRP